MLELEDESAVVLAYSLALAIAYGLSFEFNYVAKYEREGIKIEEVKWANVKTGLITVTKDLLHIKS